ncbi:hypothetical protein Dip510_001876 [Elusimicrobium posterum]|uniref:hypothetical protein n=1 Tax=Elusimicrobium posterum TaxID=3116653 RepID=UPI003C761696
MTLDDLRSISVQTQNKKNIIKEVSGANIDDTFTNLSSGATKVSENRIVLKDGTSVTKKVSSGGEPTLYIKELGKKQEKIRFK